LPQSKDPQTIFIFGKGAKGTAFSIRNGEARPVIALQGPTVLPATWASHSGLSTLPPAAFHRRCLALWSRKATRERCTSPASAARRPQSSSPCQRSQTTFGKRFQSLTALCIVPGLPAPSSWRRDAADPITNRGSWALSGPPRPAALSRHAHVPSTSGRPANRHRSWEGLSRIAPADLPAWCPE
jgi:hypothetical protein